jgi:hypothetical protein
MVSAILIFILNEVFLLLLLLLLLGLGSPEEVSCIGIGKQLLLGLRLWPSHLGHGVRPTELLLILRSRRSHRRRPRIL